MSIVVSSYSEKTWMNSIVLYVTPPGAGLAVSPGSGSFLVEGEGFVRKRGVKGVLILYNCLSMMFRKEKSIKKLEKGRGK